MDARRQVILGVAQSGRALARPAAHNGHTSEFDSRRRNQFRATAHEFDAAISGGRRAL